MNKIYKEVNKDAYIYIYIHVMCVAITIQLNCELYLNKTGDKF